MSWLIDIGNFLQKPQSAMTGSYAGLMRMFDRDQDRLDKLGVGTNPIAGLIAGLKGNIRPSQAALFLENNYSGKGNKLANTVVDIGFDPLLFAGAAIKGGVLGGKAAGLASKAGSAGKVAEGESKLSTAALRTLRRTYEGTLAAGDPLSGAAMGQVIGLGENTISRLAPQLFKGVARAAPELGDSLESVPSVIRDPIPDSRAVESLFGPTAAPRVRGNANPIEEFIGNFTGQPPPMRELASPQLAQLMAGRQSMGELGPATARIGEVGARPMGPGQMPINNLIDSVWGAGARLRPSAGEDETLSELFRLLLTKVRR